MRRLIEELLPDRHILEGIWFRFRDEIGTNLAQPDYLVKDAKTVYVFEVKLTHTRTAWVQLQDLYGPIVEHFFKLPPTLVEVCKNLSRDDDLNLIHSLDEARSNGRVYTIHWLGR